MNEKEVKDNKKEEKTEIPEKKRNKKRKIIIASAVLLIFVIIFAAIRSKKEKAVDSTTIQKGSVAEELILSGEIKADEHAQLTFSSSGKIIWMGAEEGGWVQKGEALAQLDTTKLNADFQRARSDLRDAEASVDKALDDVKDHSSDETFTQRETRTAAEVARDKAYEAVYKAEEDLKNATLKAPFEGLITDVANPYTGINTIYTSRQIEMVNPETVYFEVTADQSEISNLSVEQPVSIILDSFQDDVLTGKVVFISYTPKTDETGTVYEIKVVFDEIDINKFRIGMTGDANFILSENEDVLYVPPKYVNRDKEGKYINLGKKNKKVYIEVGIEGEDRTEIIGDIKEGEKVFD